MFSIVDLDLVSATPTLFPIIEIFKQAVHQRVLLVWGFSSSFLPLDIRLRATHGKPASVVVSLETTGYHSARILRGRTTIWMRAH